MRSSIRARAALLFAGALVTMNGITSQDTSAARGQATRSVVYGTHGMVCAAQPLAVQAGIDMLKQGGSAVDAAIATNACLGLMEPTANGLGGDLFAIVWDPKTQQLFHQYPELQQRAYEMLCNRRQQLMMQQIGMPAQNSGAPRDSPLAQQLQSGGGLAFSAATPLNDGISHMMNSESEMITSNLAAVDQSLALGQSIELELFSDYSSLPSLLMAGDDLNSG